MLYITLWVFYTQILYFLLNIIFYTNFKAFWVDDDRCLYDTLSVYLDKYKYSKIEFL